MKKRYILLSAIYSRKLDDLAFVDNGRIRLRTQKEALIERWRKVNFRLGDSDVRLQGAISYRREGREHQLITPDFQATLKGLKDLGAENIRDIHLGIEEIAVQILKGGMECGN